MNSKLLPLPLLLLFTITVNSQVLQWAKKVGNTQSDQGTRSAVDQNGNLYLVGSFQGSTVDFDPGLGTFFLSSSGAKDGFVAKYNSDGVFKWAFKIGGSNQDDVEDISVDHSGNIVITGYFRGPNVDFDPSSNASNLSSYGESGGDPGYGGDIFIAKYDTLGNYKWAFNVGSPAIGDDGTCINVDKADNILVAGYFQSSVDFNPSSTVSNILNSTNGVIFVAKYNPNGQYVWAVNAGQGFSDNSAYGIGSDAQNNVFVTGYFQGANIDFDPSPTSSATLSSNGSFDVFIIKYNPNGQYLWAKSAGGISVDVARDLTVDNNNDVYIVGDYNSSSINFNSGNPLSTQTNKGGSDLFVAKFSSAGQHLWSFGTGSTDAEVCLGVSADNANNVVITGIFNGTNVDFDPSPNTIGLTSKGNDDVYAVKYSSIGNYLCSFSVGGTGRDVARAINTLGNSTYITGYFNGSNADYDPTAGTTLLTASGDDAFFTKYDWTIIPPAGTIAVSANCVTGVAQMTFTATSGAGPFTLYINNGTSTVSYSNIQSGVPFTIPSPVSTTYILQGIKDANLCSAVTPANYVAVVSSIPITTSGNSAVCKGDSVQLNASGGLTYLWSPSAGLSNPAISNPKASPLTTTTYKVVVTNGAGCKDSTTLAVTIKPSPIINVAPANASFCQGDSIQLSASGGTTYQWRPAAGLSNASIPNPKAAPASTTNYWLIVTNADGCTDSVQKLMTKNAPAVAAASPSVSVCPGDSAQLSASGGQTFFWSPSAGLNNAAISNPKAAPAVTTIYKVVVTNTQGCRDSASVTVTLKAKPIITTSGDKTVCKGDSVQLSAAGGNSYQWSPVTGLSNAFIASPKASPLVTTVYKVSVTGSSGCSDSAVVTVFVNAPPTITINPGSASFCPGDSVQLSATGGSIYQWMPATGLSNAFIASPKAAPLVTIVYKLIVKDVNGCTDSTIKTVTRNNAPVVSVNNPAAVCPGDSAQLSASGGGSYLWSPSTGLNNPTAASPKASPSSTTSYKVVVTNTAGCKDSALATVTLKDKPVVTVSSPQMICRGDSAQLSAAGGVSYQWSPGSSLSNNLIQMPKASPPATTTYSVVVTGSNGCRGSATTLLTVNQPPTITLSPNTSVCAGDSVQLNATGGAAYIWSPSTGLNNPNAASPKASPVTSTTYSVSVFTAAGCVDSAKVTVAVNPKPVINISPAATICSGDTTQLSASGGVSYTWTPANSIKNPTVANPLAFPLTNTIYTVNVSTAAGCNDSAKTTITVSAKPLPALGKDTAVCLNEVLVLNAAIPTATAYIWNTGATNPSITVTDPGIYIVQVAVIGCNAPAIDTIVVADFPAPTLLLRQDTTICSFYTLQINAAGSGIDSYLWSTGSTDSFILVNDAGLYSVTAGNRCSDTTASVRIGVDVCAEDLFFPTAFTPNGDQRNDMLRAGYFRGFRVFDYELMVFNRWGEMVFRTTDVDKGWDGVYKGKPQPTGVFVWLAKYRKTKDGAPVMKKGTAALIR